MRLHFKSVVAIMLTLGSCLWRAPAQAATLSERAIETFLRKANPTCLVDHYERVFSGSLAGRQVAVAIFNVNSCNRANNQSIDFGVFSLRKGHVQQYRQPEDELWGQVESVKVRGTDIIAHYMLFKPSDPDCCPSTPETRIYRVREGRLVRQ